MFPYRFLSLFVHVYRRLKRFTRPQWTCTVGTPALGRRANSPRTFLDPLLPVLGFRKLKDRAEKIIKTKARVANCFPSDFSSSFPAFPFRESAVPRLLFLCFQLWNCRSAQNAVIKDKIAFLLTIFSFRFISLAVHLPLNAVDGHTNIIYCKMASRRNAEWTISRSAEANWLSSVDAAVELVIINLSSLVI